MLVFVHIIIDFASLTDLQYSQLGLPLDAKPLGRFGNLILF
jgi:hypothetical protein